MRINDKFYKLRRPASVDTAWRISRSTSQGQDPVVHVWFDSPVYGRLRLELSVDEARDLGTRLTSFANL